MNAVTKAVAVAKAPFFFENSRLMAIAINATNHNLIYRAQSKPNGPWVTDWAWINNTNQYDVMVAGLARDGRVVALAQVSTTPTVHFYIEAPEDLSSSPAWQAPVNLGLPAGVPGFSQLVTCRGSDGRVNVFGLAKDTGYVWWIFENPDRLIQETKWVTPPGQKEPIEVTVDVEAPPLTPWSNWQQLAPRQLQVMTAANNGDGTIALAGTAFDNATQHIFYTRQKTVDAKVPADWIAWLDMTQGRLDANSPALRLDPFGSLNVFAIGAESDVVQTHQVPANSDNFPPWANPFMVGGTILEIATGIDGDGHIVAVAQDDQKVIHANTMLDAATQQWSGWQPIATVAYAGPMTLDYNADGRLTLFVREGTGPQRLLCKSQVAFNSSSWEATWTLLSKSALSRYGIVRDLTPPAT
jgi:hypothetical protein